MCAAKSPISILQEYTMSKHLPFPSYDIIQEGAGFKCIGTVGNIQRLAIAENKKRAKHLCAEHILAVLQPYNSTVNARSMYEGLDCTIHTTICVEMEEPGFNAVGKLNELCSQNGKVVPTYAEIGCIEQKFVIQCSLLSHITEGRAATKKQAKQIAAREMLNRVQTSEFHVNLLKENDLEKISKQKHADIQEKVVELFKQLSATKRQDPKNNRLDYFENDAPMNNLNTYSDDNKPTYKVDVLNEIQLRDELSRLNVKYIISTLQGNPLVISLKATTTNGNTYTFTNWGNSYKDAVVGLLKKTLDGIYILNK